MCWELCVCVFLVERFYCTLGQGPGLGVAETFCVPRQNRLHSGGTLLGFNFLDIGSCCKCHSNDCHTFAHQKHYRQYRFLMIFGLIVDVLTTRTILSGCPGWTTPHYLASRQGTPTGWSK